MDPISNYCDGGLGHQNPTGICFFDFSKDPFNPEPTLEQLNQNCLCIGDFKIDCGKYKSQFTVKIPEYDVELIVKVEHPRNDSHVKFNVNGENLNYDNIYTVVIDPEKLR